MKGTLGELKDKCSVCGEKIDKHRVLKIEIFSTDGKKLVSLTWKPPLCKKHNGIEKKDESLNVKIAWES